jgi:hypothetical protein
MPEGVGYGPQFTASTGLELNYIGRHCYATSGSIDVGQSETIFLNFRCGEDNYIDGQVQVNYAADQSENALYKIYFNGVVIQSWVVPGGTQSPAPEQPCFILIPPGTQVKVTGILLSGGSTRTHFATLTGRVHN